MESFCGTADGAAAPRWGPSGAYGGAAFVAIVAALQLAAGAGIGRSLAVLALTTVGGLCAARAAVRTGYAVARARAGREAREYVVHVGDGVVTVDRPSGRIQLDVATLVGAHVDTRWEVPFLHIVSTDAQGRPSLALPLVFADPAALLAALRRAVAESGAIEGASLPVVESGAPPVSLSADVAYAAATTGDAPAGAVVVWHGRRWLAGLPMGPFAIAAGGLVAASVAHIPPALEQVYVVGLPALGLALPAWWLWAELSEVSPRRGVSMLLMPEGFVFRIGRRTTLVPWEAVSECDIEAHPLWNVPRGWHQRRSLIWRRIEEPDVRYVETFLGEPAEVVRLWTDHYVRLAHARDAAQPPCGPR